MCDRGDRHPTEFGGKPELPPTAEKTYETHRSASEPPPGGVAALRRDDCDRQPGGYPTRGTAALRSRVEQLDERWPAEGYDRAGGGVSERLGEVLQGSP